MIWIVILLASAGASSASGAEPPAETAADAASRGLLDALEEREMADVSLLVLDRIEAEFGVEFATNLILAPVAAGDGKVGGLVVAAA
jgi:hypothetical protein